MKICYIDESGGIELPESSRDASPVFVMAALIIDTQDLKTLTKDYVGLKCEHFPASFTSGKSLDHILTEIKGSQIQNMTRSPSRNRRRQAKRYRAQALDIIENVGGLMMGKIWVKEDTRSLDIKKTYGFGMQDLVLGFQHYLEEVDDHGIVVADSREHKSNLHVAHSVFTQKWKSGGDAYSRVMEVPLFAASDNHAGLQLVDLLASTFLFPMAVSAFCGARENFIHKPAKYHQVRADFGDRIKKLQYRYINEAGLWSGGLDVKNLRGGARAPEIFGVPVGRHAALDTPS